MISSSSRSYCSCSFVSFRHHSTSLPSLLLKNNNSFHYHHRRRRHHPEPPSDHNYSPHAITAEGDYRGDDVERQQFLHQCLCGGSSGRPIIDRGELSPPKQLSCPTFLQHCGVH
mmetsp:Transcript_8928/g.18917  ORF Transcript_8928/g.18917 Transcript_8928/m.18917 type:complete len:114 (-) Transcript_8928:89-430(-)